MGGSGSADDSGDVLASRMALVRIPLWISLLTWGMGPWQASQRSWRLKVASLVHIYSSGAQLTVTRSIYSSMSRALTTLQTTLADFAFPMPITTPYMAHVHPAQPFTRPVITPVDIKHSTFQTVHLTRRSERRSAHAERFSAGCRRRRSVSGHIQMYITAQRLHRTAVEEDKRQGRAGEREAKLVAAMVNAEKSMTVTELWKPLCRPSRTWDSRDVTFLHWPPFYSADHRG